MVKNVSWHWGNEQDVSFRKIKEVLVSKRCFAYYDVNKSMRMQVDALKLSFTNIHGLQSNFVECGSFLEFNPPDILALCETNLDDSIDSGNFSQRCYLPLI